MSATQNWRTRPFARVVVYCSCSFMLFTSSAPLYAALPVPSNQIPIGGVVTHGSAVINPNISAGRMTIDQSTAKAILEWQSFNIGKDAVVQFNQPSASSVALNRIMDPTNSPTAIFGVLNANGNVYLINNNGIVFGQGAQVNVHGLVASTLNIDTNLFLNASLPAAINGGKAALEGGTAPGAAITVESGAAIKTDNGGQVLMFAPVIENKGDISTPDGQTILAASKDKVYLTASDEDPNLRGLLVEVGTGGDVKNVGTIVAERGNVTLLGLAVNQSGRIRATTSVDVNGSVRLLARDGAIVVDNDPGFAPNAALLVDGVDDRPSSQSVAVATRAGTVTLGQGSVTEVVADTALDLSGKVKTAADAQTQSASRIDVVGKNIVLEDGASILAKSGRVNLRATATPNNPTQEFVTRNDSRIYVGNNVSIDVSGEDVELPMSRRVIEVELRGDQLKDSPLQRNGILRGEKVYVDIDKGSPLIADMAPELARIKRDVKERSIAGGAVNFDSQGDVVFGGAASVDISGGSVRYASGLINTTKLLSGNQVVDIGSADPNRHYDGILGKHVEIHPKWGERISGTDSIFARGTYREGFLEGAAGGALAIDSEALYGFDHLNISAAAQSGLYQRANAPKGGSIAITLGQHANIVDSATVQDVVIQQALISAGFAPTAPLPEADGVLQALTVSADKLNRSGAGSFALVANGKITLDAGTGIRLVPAATFALKGSALQIDGSITAPAGTINLATQPATGLRAEKVGNFPISIGSTALLDVSGVWTNDLADTRQISPLARKGGIISIAGPGDVLIASGARLRADGGGQIDSKGKFTGGDGGTITLATRAESYDDIGSRLLLGGEMSAYGFAKGGSLALTANAFQIGGATADINTVLLDPTFFAQGGFASYAVNSNFRGIEVVPGANVQLKQQNLSIADLRTAATQQTGADLRSFSLITELPAWQRKAVDLSLKVADTITRQLSLSPSRVLSVGRDVHIEADPGATIALASDRSIFVDGVISAPGGTINLAINAPEINGETGFIANQSIWLGEHAQLHAGATQVLKSNPAGLRLGTVYDAGTINLLARRGAIIAQPGSLLDVSGATFTQDYVGSQFRSGYLSQRVNAAAGAINFTAAEGLGIYSDLRGFAAGNDGLGGSLSFRIDTNQRAEQISQTPFLYTARELQVSETLPEWDDTLQFGQVLPATLTATGLVSAAQVRAGGFSRLELGASNVGRSGIYAASGRISFAEDLSLSLTDSLLLDSTNIALNGNRVDIGAGIVGVGRSSGTNVQQITESVQTGSGRFSITAKFIELLGNIGVSGAESIALNSAGDIRVRSHIDNGSGRTLAAAHFTAPGDMALRAAQIYPSTLTDYLFDLTGSDSVFTTAGNGGVRTPLLSAAGTLRVRASEIEHGGVLAAPLGSVALTATENIRLAAGSVIDVSGNNQLIPFGRLQGGDISWIYPIDPALPLLIEKVPEKQVRLDARDVVMEAGSRVELSGGGDIAAFEKVPGPGGSQDFLEPAYAQGAFAVMPLLNSAISPYDAVEMRGTGIVTGQTIYLEGGNGLPAGEYSVLPAHYALLPGAFLISPSGKTLAAGSNGARSDGVPLVSGRFGRAFAAQYDAQWQGFYIEPGAAARTRTEYTEAKGDDYFADRDIDLAKDAGLIGIAAREKLQLDGLIGSAAQYGHGAQMDILADLLEIVATEQLATGADGVVRVDANALSRIGVDSLLLGGSRRRDGDGIAIDVQSSRVTVADGAMLTAPDLIIAAQQQVAVAAGATVTGSGQSSQNYTMLNIDSAAGGSGEGALLRVSSAGQVDVKRNGVIPVNGATGALDIAAGARVQADKSMLLDATGAMRLNGTLEQVGGSINLSANRISLGENIGAVEGVVFDNAKLASLTPAELRFSSRSSIDFYSDVAFLNQRAELNAGALRAMTPGNVQVRASDTLQLSNTAGVTDAAVGAGSGTLLLAAKTVELGSARDKATTLQLSGFDKVQIGAVGLTQKVTGGGEFKLDVAHDLDIVSDLISGAAGSNTAVTAGGAVNLLTAGAPAAVAQAGARVVLGAQLSVEGQRIDHRTAIEMPSGVVALTAKGSAAGDSVILHDASSIDVSGRAIQFPNNSVRTTGGSIHLRADAGNIEAAEFSSVRIGGAEGGAGGVLDIAAPNGQIRWSGSVAGTGGNSYEGGSLKLDAIEITDLGGWLARIAGAGIDKLVSIRSRGGDVAIDRNVTAQAIDIAADSGSLTVSSTLDASAADGGSIALNAGKNLTLAAPALLRAEAAGTEGRGGNVQLATRGNDGSGLTFAAGSRIAVAGNGGRDGHVTLRAPRTASNDDLAITDNGIAISGAERIDVIGVEQRSSTVLDNALMAQIDSSATAFMSVATAIQNRLGNLFAQDNTYLRPGAEVASTADLTVTESIDFSALRYGSDQQAGELTLRAAGNLILQGDLLDGFAAAHDSIADGLGLAYYTLLGGKSWDYRVVAGADLSAAKAAAVVGDSGDLRIEGGVDVITGAGDIELTAGRNIDVQAADTVIASLGNQQFREYTSRFDPSATDLLGDTGTFDPYLLFLIGLRSPLYPENGGNVSLSAGQDVRFAKTTHFFSDWIERVGGEITVDDGSGVPIPPLNLTTWGILLSDIQNEQGVAVFGGGNLDVSAGNDVVNLFATLASTGKQDGIGENHVSVIGGGNAAVSAGRDILSPRVMVDKGLLALHAGRDIGASGTGATDFNAVLALADTQVLLSAGRDIAIDAVINSTVMPLSVNQVFESTVAKNYFFTYSDSARLASQSLSGDIRFNNRASAVSGYFAARNADNSADAYAFAIYPGSLEANASQGSIYLQNSMTLFPSMAGQLVLNAADDVVGLVGNSNASLNLSDVDPAMLPSVTNPATNSAYAAMLMPEPPLGVIQHGPQPLHQDDLTVALINALYGDIRAEIATGSSASFKLIVNKPVKAVAGRDIANTNFYIQHSADKQSSELVAGRDLGFPLQVDPSTGILTTNENQIIEIAGPGRLDVIAGRNIDLGGSQGISSIGNQKNSALPDSGADINVLAGINGPSALTDPILYNAFADRYFSAVDTVEGSYIDWFAQSGFSGDTSALISVFTGKTYATASEAIAAYDTLPVLTRQAIGLEAWQIDHGGARNYTAELVDFVSFDRFGGNLTAALNSVLNPAQPYTSNTEAAAALALLPVAQQHRVALQAFNASSSAQRRELLLTVLFEEVRNGGIEDAKGLVIDSAADGFARSREAIALMFPGDKWKGDVDLVVSAIRTSGDGDINIVVPGGDLNVGLASNINGLNKKPDELGLIAQRYGSINAITSGNINVNQSRIFSLDGGDITLWASDGDIDAGRGAKTALAIPPLTVKIDPITGNTIVQFPPAVAGSGIQTAGNTRKRASDRGPLLDDSIVVSSSDTRVSRQRYFRSLAAGDVYLFAPQGAINAGDAGISVGGDLLLAAQQVLGANNISVGGVSIGVPTTTSISAGTLSLGDTASSATESATNSMNDAIRDAAAALAESSAAFVTVDVIGLGD